MGCQPHMTNAHGPYTRLRAFDGISPMVVRFTCAVICCLFLSKTTTAYPETAHHFANATQCVQDQSKELRLLWQVKPGTAGYYNIFTHPCSGGIYIVDPNSKDKNLAVLNEGWWLQGMYRPIWHATDRLILRGSFLTGVGPSGNRPFEAHLSARLTEDGWLVEAPVTDLDPLVVPNEYACGLVEVTSQAALKTLGLDAQPWATDFARERLVFYGSDLPSGSIAHVSTDERGYLLKHEAPFIGATYTLPGLVWMVVPKDGKLLGRSSTAEAEPCQNCRTGVMVHPRVKWYVPASTHTINHPTVQKKRPCYAQEPAKSKLRKRFGLPSHRLIKRTAPINQPVL